MFGKFWDFFFILFSHFLHFSYLQDAFQYVAIIERIEAKRTLVNTDEVQTEQTSWVVFFFYICLKTLKTLWETRYFNYTKFVIVYESDIQKIAVKFVVSFYLLVWEQWRRLVSACWYESSEESNCNFHGIILCSWII